MPPDHPLPPTRKRVADPSTSRQTKTAFRRPAALRETECRTTCFRPARANCAKGSRYRNSAWTHFHRGLSPRSDHPAGTARESPSPDLSTKESERRCRTQSVRIPVEPPSSPPARHFLPPPPPAAAPSPWPPCP